VFDFDAVVAEGVDGLIQGKICGSHDAGGRFHNMRSVGVMGDHRTYDYAIALRAVTTDDFMTAESAKLPWDLLEKVTSRIVNEVDHVNRVVYDLTGKPPGTIEFE